MEYLSVTAVVSDNNILFLSSHTFYLGKILVVHSVGTDGRGVVEKYGNHKASHDLEHQSQLSFLANS